MMLHLFIVLCGTFFMSQSAQVIMFMGPSCAGKSTLSKHLCEQLKVKHEQWAVIDFDDVSESIDRLRQATDNLLKKDINVIIDTNTYEDGMEKRLENAVKIIKIIVTAPLEVLLERDEKRTHRLKRDEERAFWCKHFVIESFHRSLTWSYDLIINSAELSISQACEVILKHIPS